MLLKKIKPAHFVLFAVYVGCACSGMSVAIFGCLVTWISHDLGLSSVASGGCQASFFGGLLIGSLVMGRLLGICPSRYCWLIGMGCTVLGCLLTSIASLPILLLGRALAGFGLSATMLFAMGLIVAVCPDRTSLLLNLLQACTAGSAALTLAVGRPVAEMLNSWSAVLWLIGGLSVVPMIVAVVLPGMSEIAADKAVGFRSLFRVAGHPLLLPLLLALIVYVSLEQSITVFLPVYLEEQVQIVSTTATGITAMFWLGLIVGRVCSAMVGKRLGEGLQIILGGLGMCLCIMLVMVVSDVPTLMALTFFAGFFGGPIIPLAFASSGKRLPSSCNSAMTVCQLCCSAGGMLGPLLTGGLYQHFIR
jgi:predicted MFS family arabinose efflux permease